MGSNTKLSTAHIACIHGYDTGVHENLSTGIILCVLIVLITPPQLNRGSNSNRSAAHIACIHVNDAGVHENLLTGIINLCVLIVLNTFSISI